MRCVITGGKGQLATDLAVTLRDYKDIWVASHEALDITRPAETSYALKEYQPDVVINCAAYNNVDVAEVNPMQAVAVNAWGVKTLAQCCAEYGARLVHFSTDQVFGADFDPSFSVPYSVDDPQTPMNMYGITKMAGEAIARAYHADSVIIRTCGLYGNHGRSGKPSFAARILDMAAAGKPLYVVDDQVCTPTYTAHLAEMVTKMLEKHISAGIYHVTNSGECSWYKFARTLLNMAGMDACLVPVTTDWYCVHRPGYVPRPRYSVLDNAPALLSRYTNYQMPSWQSGITTYLQERADIRSREPRSVDAGHFRTCGVVGGGPPDVAGQQGQQGPHEGPDPATA